MWASTDRMQQEIAQTCSLRMVNGRQQNGAMPDSLRSGQQDIHTRGQGCGSLEGVCAGETDGDPALTVLHFSFQALQTGGSKLALGLQAALRRWRFKQALWAVCELLQARDGILVSFWAACGMCKMHACSLRGRRESQS